MSDEFLGTIWVCVCCMLNHANGECGCENNDDNAHKLSRDALGRYDGGTVNNDGIPLSRITRGYSIAMGMSRDEHDCHSDECASLCDCDHDHGCDCEGADECDCETNTFSHSQCEGCGSYLYGERHAVGLFKVKRRRRAKPRPVPAIVAEPAPSVAELVALIDSPPPTHCGQCRATVDHCVCCRICGLAFGH